MDHVDHILIVDDDREIRELVSGYLKKNGLRATAVPDGRQMRAFLDTDSVDLIILDVMMPGDDGLVLCRQLRAGKHKATPILMLTARNDETDRIIGLELGADDYLVKPFAFSELLARINALGRRPAAQEQKTTLRIADLEMDLIQRRVTRQGQAIDLQPREFSLLEVLMRGEGRVITRTMLLERVWDFHFDPKTSVVETHISRLRAKVDRPFDVPLIHTVRNTGYSLHAPS